MSVEVLVKFEGKFVRHMQYFVLLKMQKKHVLDIFKLKHFPNSTIFPKIKQVDPPSNSETTQPKKVLFDVFKFSKIFFYIFNNGPLMLGIINKVGC